MYGTCLLLLIAGHETTTRLVGNGLFALLNHPDQFELLKQDHSKIPNAIEEMLRYEPPVHATVRFANENMTYRNRDYPRILLKFRFSHWQNNIRKGLRFGNYWKRYKSIWLYA